MKKLVSLILVVAMLLTLAACGTTPALETKPADTPTTEATNTSEDTENVDIAHQSKKIVYVSRNLNDMYAAFLVKVFESKIAELYPGWEMTTLDVQEDFTKSSEFIYNAVTMGADGIIGQFMSVNPVDAAREVGEENGVPVVAFDALYPESVGSLAMVNADNYRMGHMIGEYAAEILPENARIAILSIGRKMDVVVQRDNGISDALADLRPDVEIVDIGDVDFDKNVGIQITSDWLTQYGPLDGILGDSDTCALAAIEAYRAAGYDPKDYVFIGLDGGSDACNAILAGELDGSILQSAEQYAELTLKICADTFEGKIDPASSTDQPSLIIDPVLITSDNVNDYVTLYKAFGLM